MIKNMLKKCKRWMRMIDLQKNKNKENHAQTLLKTYNELIQNIQQKIEMTQDQVLIERLVELQSVYEKFIQLPTIQEKDKYLEIDNFITNLQNWFAFTSKDIRPSVRNRWIRDMEEITEYAIKQNVKEIERYRVKEQQERHIIDHIPLENLTKPIK